MSDITSQFCESTGFTDITLYQYGHYTSNMETPLLPFLNENTLVTYVTQGKGTVKLGGNVHTISDGMVVVLFPGQAVHFTPAEDTGPLSAMWMEVCGTSLEGILMRAGLTLQKPTLIPIALAEECQTERAFAALTSQDGIGPLRATGLMLELLDCLLHEAPHPCQPKVANLQQYYVNKSIRYIERKYPQDISVEDVAEYCGLNRSYLGKLFRDATGMTTQEYLIRHRMRIACSYLERAAAPIATIARSVGYPNQLHFSRAFHKVLGIPPREWQKRNRKV